MASIERESSKNHHNPLGDGDEALPTCSDDAAKKTRRNMTSVAAKGTAAETAPLCVGSESIDSSSCGNGSAGSFGPIPDENWGSDHLALGVELTLCL